MPCIGLTQGCGRAGHVNVLALLPDGDHNDDVAGGDEDGRDDKDGERDQGHVESPLPGLVKVNPTLSPIMLCLSSLEFGIKSRVKKERERTGRDTEGGP